MDLVKYVLCDIEIMMVDIGGVLYCSTPQLEKVFGIERNNLTRLVNKYPQDFSNVRCSSLTSSDEHRKEMLEGLGLSRLRKDTRLWSEDDVIGITWLVRSDIARKCRAEFKEILKQHCSKRFITRDVFDDVVTKNYHLAAQMESLVEVVNAMSGRISEIEGQNKELASCAGRALRLVR